MSKLTIDLDPETHQSLRELARKDERSLTQYIQRTLRQHAGTLVATTTTPATEETPKEEEDPYAKWR